MPTVYGRKGFGARAIKNDSGTRPISGGRYVPGSGLRLHSYADRSAKLTVPLRNGFAALHIAYRGVVIIQLETN